MIFIEAGEEANYYALCAFSWLCADREKEKRDKCLVRYGTGNARLDLVMFAYSIIQWKKHSFV